MATMMAMVAGIKYVSANEAVLTGAGVLVDVGAWSTWKAVTPFD